MSYHKKMISALIILMATHYSVASTKLLEHATVTSQAMSAFYMYGLSNGDRRYRQEFEKYIKRSEILLAFNDLEDNHKLELYKEWKLSMPDLTIAYSKEYDWDIDIAVRLRFRAYLTKIFSLLEKESLNFSWKEKILYAMFQVEVISARFFDVSSSYDGVDSLSGADIKRLDSEKINRNFQMNLKDISENISIDSYVKELSTVKTKWKFIEQGVVNYNKHGLFFIVYSTKNSIRIILDNAYRYVLSKKYIENNYNN